MDVLSDVLAVLRTGRPRSALAGWDGTWAQEFAAVPGAAGFHVVLRGSCWLLHPAATPSLLTAGDVVFRPHGQGHTLADSPTTRPTGAPCTPESPRPAFRSDAATVVLCGAYELDPTMTHPLLHDLPEVVHVGSHPRLRAAVDLLTGELTGPGHGTDAVIPALLDTLLVYVLRDWLEHRHVPVETGWAAALREPATSAALRAVHRAPAHPWTVASLAAAAHLSRAPFARRFTRLLGQPPLTYVTWWRMTLAARLLRTTDLSLSEIAGETGYTSEYAFAAAFKRHHGVAPGRYRRARVP